MYSTLGSGDRTASGLKRLARRDLPTTPRTPAPIPAPSAKSTAIVWPVLSVGVALAWLRRGSRWVAVLAIAGVALGYGYSVLATPKFTAYTDLIIDPASLQVVSGDLYASSLQRDAQLLDVESKLRVLTSGNVLSRVVEELKLDQDPEFVSPQGPLSLPFLVGGAEPDRNPGMAALDTLEKKIAAWREERSYVVTLGVSTESADKSVTIANAVVAAFQAELAKSEADGAGRAAQSLIDRLAALKADVTQAEDAVESFKRANGLQESDGELVNSQSMTQLNKNAIEAQQALVAAESRYRELTDPVTGKANADAVQTPTMVALRTQYGLLRQQADLSATLYGPLHPTRAAAERQVAGLQQQIDAEANRAVQAARLDLDQAKRTVAQLDQQTTDARGNVAADDQALVTLRSLERDAKAKSTVYEAFLNRANEVSQREQLDTTNIRVISPAIPPSVRSWPPRGVVVASAGGALGAALGIALALALGFVGELRRPRKA